MSIRPCFGNKLLQIIQWQSFLICRDNPQIKVAILMKALSSIVSVIITVFAVSQSVAQQWGVMPLVMSGIVGNYIGKQYAPSSGVVYDTVHHEFWAGHASHAIVSDDYGITWSEPALPSTPSDRNIFMTFATGAGRVFCVFTNTYKSRMYLEYDRTNREWVEIDSSRRAGVLAAVDSVAVLLVSNGNIQQGRVSYAREYSWHSVDYNAPVAGLDFPNIQEVHPTIVAVQNLDQWIEYSSETGRTTPTKIPQTALYYNYSANKEAILAGFRTLLPNPDPNNSRKIPYFNIGVSTDGGDTWHQYDTIHFVNSDEIISNTEYQKNHLRVSAMHLHGNTVTIILADGTVFSTNDNGNTFWYRGVGEFVVSDDNGRLWPVTFVTQKPDSEGNLYYVRNGQLFRVPSDIRQPLELVAKGKQFLGLALSSGVMLATGPKFLARSTDNGRTWLLTGRVTRRQEFKTLPQQIMIFNRIHATDTNDVTVFSYTGGIQGRYKGELGSYILDGSNDQIPLPTAYNIRGEILDEYNSDFYTLNNYVITEYTKDSIVHLLKANVIRLKSETTVNLFGDNPPENYGNMLRFYQRSNTEVFCQRTALWHSTDGGATWEEVGKGLPADSNGRLGTIASMLRLRDGRLLCGMKGFTVYSQREFSTDNYDTSYVSGGLWVSSDNGQNWQELPHPAVAGSNVWFLKRKGDLHEQRLATVVDGGIDTLVAAVGTVETKRLLDAIYERDPDGNPYFTGFYDTVSVTTMRDARIVTSTDGGVSWRVTYNEPKSRPGFSPRREIISRRDGSLLAATVESGVLWSPNGLVWTPLGNDTLNQTVILDIDVDTNDVVYAATDKGIFYINDRPTSVDDGKLNIPSKNGRFFSMWTYPTPVRTQVQVRLNNVEALSNTIRSLKLYNIYGTEVADYSTAIPQQSAGRAEFTLSLPAHIASGVYLLALDTGVGIVSSKLFVAEP
ncbi:MAG: exo-alpha-sialidase [Bacteroidetes bacterium]|nr:MAG: exo-alpha-sialidase [Bacteroidota bacterium]